MNPSQQPRDPGAETGGPAREPIFNLPGAIIAVIGALALVHLARLSLGDAADLAILSEFAVVPARFALEYGWMEQRELVERLTAGLARWQANERLAAARYFLDGGGSRWWSLMTYGALHAGTMHIIVNCLWLAIFGSPLARRLGPARFLLLLGAGTVAGAVLHVLVHMGDVVPLVGASAGVSAATGAAARFVFSSGLRLGAMADDRAVRAMPALSLAGIVRNRSALMFIVIWFVSNWLFGAGVTLPGEDNQSVAWEAHVGGFVAGLMLFPWLDRPARNG